MIEYEPPKTGRDNKDDAYRYRHVVFQTSYMTVKRGYGSFTEYHNVTEYYSDGTIEQRVVPGKMHIVPLLRIW